MPQLILLSGSAEQVTYRLQESSTTLGSASFNTVILQGRSVAKEHCRIQKQGDSFVLQDLGSSIGTLVNSQPVATQILVDGDEIEIGEFVFLYHHEEDFESGTLDYSEGDATQLDIEPEPEEHTDEQFELEPATVKLLLFRGGELLSEQVIGQGETVIGRDKRSHCVVDEANVSRQHCRLLVEGDQFFLEDLNSSNGTYVNKQKISGKVAISPNDEIMIGRVELVLQAATPDVKDDQTDEHEVVEDDDRTMVAADFPAEPSPTSQLDEPQVPRLRLVFPDGARREFRLLKTTITLGRDDSNDIVIPDDSISRCHAIIFKEGGKYKIEDQNSLNGIVFNGQRIQLNVLNEGDCFSIGAVNAEFRVTTRTLEQPAAEPLRVVTAPVEPQKKKPPKLLIALVAAIVVAVAFLVVTILDSGPKVKPGKTLRTKPREVAEEAQTSSLAKMETYQNFMRGKEYFDSYQWNKAIQEFDLVLAQNPNHAEALNLKEIATNEKRNYQLLARGQAQLESAYYQAAIETLEKVASDSAYGLKAETLIAEAKSNLALERIDVATALLKRGERSNALKELEDAQRLDPTNESIAELRAQIVQPGSSSIQPVEPAKPRTQTRTTSEPRRERTNASGQARTLFEQAITAYLAGDLDKSLKLLIQIQNLGLVSTDPTYREAMQAKATIERINDYYKTGLRYQKAGDAKAANDAWKNIPQLDRTIAGTRHSIIYAKIRENLRSDFITRAATFYKQRQYCNSYRAWQKVLEFEPNNPEAQEGIARIEKMAIDFYREGYFQSASNPDMARKAYERVKQILCSDHEYYTKAEAGIAGLAR